jgi:hypothetical protein
MSKEKIGLNRALPPDLAGPLPYRYNAVWGNFTFDNPDSFDSRPERVVDHRSLQVQHGLVLCRTPVQFSALAAPRGGTLAIQIHRTLFSSAPYAHHTYATRGAWTWHSFSGGRPPLAVQVLKTLGGKATPVPVGRWWVGWLGRWSGGSVRLSNRMWGLSGSGPAQRYRLRWK